VSVPERKELVTQYAMVSSFNQYLLISKTYKAYDMYLFMEYRINRRKQDAKAKKIMRNYLRSIAEVPRKAVSPSSSSFVNYK